MINREQSLAGIPIVNDGITVIDRADGKDGLELTVRLRRAKGFLSRFMPPLYERRVRLDTIGSAVFRLIDGQRTARDIIDQFVRAYRLNRREAELSTVEFLRSLAARQIISIVIK